MNELLAGIEFIFAILILIVAGVPIGMWIEHVINNRRLRSYLCLDCYQKWLEDN